MRIKVVFIILAAVLAAGCKSSQPETESIRDDTTARLAVLDKSGENADENKELVLSMRKPLTLNPLLNTDTTVDKALKLIFEPLCNISEDQSVKANIAEQWSLSPDGLSMRIKLRDGLKWQDGEPVTAYDVEYSYNTIRNAPEDSVYKYCLMNIRDYHAEDSLDFIINYSAPYFPCEYNLAFPIIPRHYYEGNSDTDFAPLGSGAYSLREYDSKEYSLEAAEGINGSPKIKNVKILITPDDKTDFDAFNQGVTDVLDTNDLDRSGIFATKECNCAEYSTNYFEFLGFNNSRDTFRSQPLRQAVAYCIDREQILSGIYMNSLEDSLTPINPSSYMSSSGSLAKYDYSPDEALKTLRNAGIAPESISFSILVDTDSPTRVETADIIADSLNRTGMKVTVNKKPFAEYSQLIASDEFDVFLGGTKMRSGFDLRPLLMSSYVYTGTNYVNFSDAKMDTLLSAYITAPGETSGKTALGEAERYISVQLPLIGIGFRRGAVLSDIQLRGVTIPYISDCYVDCEKWSFD